MVFESQHHRVEIKPHQSVACTWGQAVPRMKLGTKNITSFTSTNSYITQTFVSQNRKEKNKYGGVGCV